jgi:hypothetical protein
VFRTWINFFKRSPRAGDGKDTTMSHLTESPGTGVPGNAPNIGATSAPPAPAPDVARQIADLTDAVNRLVKTQEITAPRPALLEAPQDIGGDLPGGDPPSAGIDVSKLSALQQIAIGLRGAKPVGPVVPGVLRARQDIPGSSAEETAPAGAD